MTVYAYRCRSCGTPRDSNRREDDRPCPCGGVSQREFCVNLRPSMQPHFNLAVGKHVSNDREFNDALKLRAEENFNRTGFDTDFVRVDPGDLPPKQDDAILETRAKVIRDNNINPDTLTIPNAV